MEFLDTDAGQGGQGADVVFTYRKGRHFGEDVSLGKPYLRPHSVRCGFVIVTNRLDNSLHLMARKQRMENALRSDSRCGEVGPVLRICMHGPIGV